MGEYGFNNLQRGLTDEQRSESRERLSELGAQATKQRLETLNQDKIDKFNSNPNAGYNFGEMFGGFLDAVSVIAKKPVQQTQQEEKPNYTPYLIGGVAVLLLVVLLKKR